VQWLVFIRPTLLSDIPFIVLRGPHSVSGDMSITETCPVDKLRHIAWYCFPSTSIKFPSDLAVCSW
jgi:hypothetical protein